MLQQHVLRGIIVALAVGMLGTAAYAGPVTDFNNAMNATYAEYRNALFQSNTKNREASEKTLAAFDAKWSALVSQYKAAPPPHYADDAKWAESLDAVTAVIAQAKAEVAKGNLPATHESLEKVRDVLSALRARNGVVVYSDRVNAFHHTMEEVLNKPYGGLAGAGLTELTEDAAVLSYLGDQMKTTAPVAVTASPEFAPALAAVLDAVRELQTAARAGDSEKIKAARAKIKPAFGKLFVKFG